ncbi:hypothetical protein [Dyadobacter aurulentus]|uniref:hypothetical protein n=1 Tax=Dyadobacter sp. UC 10 TaxID=2605428 RepID=UPI0011F0D883|nr:hypothetical protein [Dyadobacter sp. UC 10]KAA0990859.1 hypothetical protein FXO21_12195 [Dyadobacter sp. UC 10]
MKLTKQLPVALGLACALMLSSCSKEDIATPQPQAESINMHSNEKVESLSPSILPTQTEYLGEAILPNGWQRNNTGFSTNPEAYPVGVSNRYRLWGDPAKLFVQGMPLIPWASNLDAFITVTTSSILSKTNKSSVKTKITGLWPGKKYALTVYVGSSLPKAAPGIPYATFAKSCLLTLGYQNTSLETVVDLTSYKACWVQKVIAFTALGPQMDLAFSASPAQAGQYAYAHLLVSSGAVKQVN